MDPNRFQFERDIRAALRVPRPIDVFPLQTTVGTVFTARDDADFQIEHLAASNVTHTDYKLTVYLVPSGGSAATANAIVFERVITKNSVFTLFNRENMGVLQPGMSLQALGEANNAINMWGYGYDYQGVYSNG